MRECVTRFLKTQQRPPRSASLWIGPEGDFSLVEIEQINRDAGAQPISLGPWVLRTDTATIASLAILNHEIRAARLPTRERT
jgi:16S rRNA (uracil1498-N3)-methyltransferase